MLSTNVMTRAAIALRLDALRDEPCVELAIRLEGLATVFTLRGRVTGDPERLAGWTLRVPAGDGFNTELPLRLERFVRVDVVDGVFVATSGASRLELRAVSALAA